MPSVGGDFYRLLGTQVHPQTSVCFQLDSLVVHSSSTGARSGQESQSWPSCGNMKLEGTKLLSQPNTRGLPSLNLAIILSFPHS